MPSGSASSRATPRVSPPISAATSAARSASRPVTTTDQPCAAYCRAISRPSPAVPPATSSLFASLIELALLVSQTSQVVPVSCVPIRVAARRLRRLRLEPAQRTAPHVAEAVHASDACPRDIARPDRVLDAVEGRHRLALEEVVRLLERVVVRARDAVGVVLHHEHRRQLG